MNKKILSYLTALIILFHGGANIVASAENPELTTQNIIINGLAYTPLEIDTIFNMTAEESQKEVSLVSTSVLHLYYKELKFLIPSITFTKKVVSKDGAIEEGEILLSFLQKETGLSNSELNKILELCYGEVSQCEEISTNKVMGYGFEIAGVFFLRYDYFKDVISKENFSRFTSTGPDMISNYFKSEKDYDKLSEDFITAEKLLEIYKNNINPAYWPVKIILSDKNKNKKFPDLKEEILNRKLDDKMGFMVLSPKEDDNIRVMIIEHIDDSRLGYDLFTGEKIQDAKSILQKQYIENIGLDVSKDYFIWLFYIYFNGVDKNLIEKHPVIQHFGLRFVDCETIGDVVDLYQHLPLEYQVDYSYFDFTKSPNVVQPSQ